MAYKTILALLDSPANARQVTDFAFDIARQHSGHIIGVHAETMVAVPMLAPMDIPDPGTIEALHDAAHRTALDVEREFKLRAGGGSLSFEWRSFVSGSGYGAGGIIDSARSADIVVACQGNPDISTETRTEVENFLYESGRPVLLVPYVLKEPRPIRRVLIAWNGSREASRATFDSLHFLKAAESVEVFCVDQKDSDSRSPEVMGAEIASTLKRHGIEVAISLQRGAGQSAAKLIENRLADNSIDLLVMGAYGHSRWWEMLFGGVTRNVLASMTALTLMSR